MYNYIIGKIVSIEPSEITLDHQGIGYRIITPNPYKLKLDEVMKIHIYHHVREDEISLFGFETVNQKKLFKELLSVKGIGPKSALAVLASATVEEILKAIESGDAKYLNRFPGIGPKASQQIILDLKGKVNLGPLTLKRPSHLDEVEDALRSLGYKNKEIDRIVKKLDPKKDTASLIKDALRLIGQ